MDAPCVQLFYDAAYLGVLLPGALARGAYSLPRLGKNLELQDMKTKVSFASLVARLHSLIQRRRTSAGQGHLV